jgi:hypothetical protein
MATRKTKSRYRVLVDIDYPTNDKAIKRLLAGESVSIEEQARVERKVGEVVSDIPTCSLPWLIAGKLIEEVQA